jgi:hypothetical protein
VDDKDAAAFMAELDQLGEDEVRQRLAAEAYDPRELPFVREWLLQRDEERARDRELRAAAARAEELGAQKGGSWAAWGVAIVAVIALAAYLVVELGR